MQMKVKVKLRLLKIEDELEVELKEKSTVKDLLEKLTSIYGEKLARLIGDSENAFSVIVMSNGEIRKRNNQLKDKDELFLILPVSGG